MATWTLFQDALKMAEAFQVKHGRPKTLVIAAANVIAKEDDRSYISIQSFAKCAVQKT